MTTVAVLAKSRVRLDDLRRLAPEHEFRPIDPGGDLSLANGASVALGGNDPARVGALLAAAPSIRWYATISAGVDHLVAAGFAARPGLLLTDNSGVFGPAIGEQIIAYLFMAAKRLNVYGRAQQRGEWADKLDHRELRGATLVVHGLGSIGGEAGRLAAALGMRVIGVRRRAGEPPPGIARVVGPESLAEVAAEADYLAIAAPLTPQTRGSVSAAVIARMRPTAWIVNIARGQLVDEPALVAALAEGRLAGAALDVFSVEPLPRGHPFWTMPNVIITPHSAGSSISVGGRTAEAFVLNLRRFAAGAPLANLVDPEAGY